jgi:hypothetical protein
MESPLDISIGAIPDSTLVGDRLRIIHLSLDWVIKNRRKMPWLKNAKKHDVGGIWQSIQKFGFVDAAKWDNSLNGGNGGIVYGNGRHECLLGILLEARQKGEEPPRGIPVSESGDWAIPITIGVDQDSESMAIALGIDHNNLTYTGGSGGLNDLLKMYDQTALVSLLTETAEDFILPVTMDEDILASLLARSEGEGGEEGDGMSDDLPDSPVRMVQLFLDKDTQPLFLEAIGKLSADFDYENLTDCVYQTICNAAGVN